MTYQEYTRSIVNFLKTLASGEGCSKADIITACKGTHSHYSVALAHLENSGEVAWNLINGTLHHYWRRNLPLSGKHSIGDWTHPVLVMKGVTLPETEIWDQYVYAFESLYQKCPWYAGPQREYNFQSIRRGDFVVSNFI